MIKLSNISKKYNDNYVLKNISLELPDKGLVMISGVSGSGKTTLLNIIGGIISYDGSLSIDGVEPSKLSNKELSSFRLKNLGYVFQSFNLLQLETVFNNVKMPLETISNCSTFLINKRVDDILKELGIHHLRKKTINKLSGGEKQRVAIAKALVCGAKIILCDEPTGALDNSNTNHICEILKRVSLTSLVIVVTHDTKSFKNYADRTIEIKDGVISKDEITDNKLNETKELLVLGNSKHQKNPRLPLSFKIKHAIHKIGSKRIRFMISNFMLSLSLTGIGLSFMITSTLSTKIQTAFASFMDGNQILVTSRHQSLNDFGSVFSASERDVIEISHEYESFLEGYGVTYLVNFENYFKDGNSVWIRDDKYSFRVTSLSIRGFNDYVWIDATNRSKISPSLEGDLQSDEVVLGLSYADMVNIAYSFRIKRNYESLANYIYHNNIYLTLHVKNNSWQYEDEQIFLVKGVFETEKSQLFHTSHLWNKELFEDEMRFPSNDGSDMLFPWEMYKLYYLNTKDDPSLFQKAILNDDTYHDFVFEHTSNQINQFLCKKNNLCSTNRLLVYTADKNTFNTGSLLEIIRRNKDFKNYYFLSSGGYVSYGSMLLSGFSSNTYFSLSKERLDSVTDLDSSQKDESFQIDLPKGVLKGYFMDALSDTVKFSSKMNNLISGHKPTSNKEIVISKAMADKLDNGHDVLDSYLYISSKMAKDNGVEGNVYNTAKVKIVGINDSNKNYVYHDSYWTISFFRDELGYSSFSLCPNSLVIELDDNVDAVSIVNRLNKTYYDYVFSSPIEEISKSINSTLNFVKVIVILFSALSGSISILLLITLLVLNILESQHEVNIFLLSGISKRDANSQFVVDSLVQTFIAFLVSMFELVLIDVLMGKIIDNTLGTTSAISISYQPILFTFIIAFSVTYLLSKTVVILKTPFLKKK